MPKLTIKEVNRVLDVEENTTILMAAYMNGIFWGMVCGGNAACGTCMVHVQSGGEHLEPRNKVEAMLARFLMLKDDQRLGCQTRVKGDLVVSVPALSGKGQPTIG
ncbi:MAG: (2Fe-2S)-binding protein [Nitrospirae bacterium]|nr:(2Fe-2S)-binding protein [Nitrospirota bacterium]